jgi:phosphomannomutase
MLEDYVEHLLNLVDVGSMRSLKVVIDAGNGMAGYTAPAVFKELNTEVIEMYLEAWQLEGETIPQPKTVLIS